jgi:hypothetical protein
VLRIVIRRPTQSWRWNELQGRRTWSNGIHQQMLCRGRKPCVRLVIWSRSLLRASDI